jgi:hypothetical protein
MPLWSVVLVGAFVNIAVTWFFDMRSQSMHFWMTVMFSGLLGLLIFLLAAMDNPFRGEISVGPEAFEQNDLKRCAELDSIYASGAVLEVQAAVLKVIPAGSLTIIVRGAGNFSGFLGAGMTSSKLQSLCSVTAP